MIPNNANIPEEKHSKEKKKKDKKNPLDHYLDELECYDDGCTPNDLMSSGE
ncbi:hypothetical protein HOD05_04525 [Candidatus Woesearchaeota archaeon]|jgi:hypothetical protein|nr:hypothetical protein [Candidatus Woesearchaeota archaeon]MBT4150421.1 hypothetical protein [Candidatus Woesearchaeota archaeon]MBT4247504.1 hypothetical protein [Candidatus Woesearchaeota archaeon]MBT4434457.1 hypothetical protein [Candidatus Woesearchaeota archaeon]MBT7331689.1 hypothetical protein [Candidatus Woesearchaeota archaeon]